MTPAQKDTVNRVFANVGKAIAAYERRIEPGSSRQCGEIRFVVQDSDAQLRQFRVPSLRNVAERAPYMHAGQFGTLREVVEHYNKAPAAPQGHSELKPLGLTEREVDQLVAFLGTLSGPVRADAKWLQAPAR